MRAANAKALFAALARAGCKTQGGAGWQLACGDSLQILPQLPAKSVNLVFADPPYNLQLKNSLYRPNNTRVDGVQDDWDKFPSFAEYDRFCARWLGECRRLLTDDGAIWVMGTYHNIGRLARLLQDAGFWLLNDVIWQKTNPMPNFRGVRFANATETLLWAKKSEAARATFNHRVMKAENGGKQMRNVWEFPVCGGGERLRLPGGGKLHSTQKPAALARRALLATTKPGDVVFDPFLGTGTTAQAARALGRVAAGVEKQPNYFAAACARVAAARPPTKLQLAKTFDPPLPARVSFDEIIRSGKVRAGQYLYDKKGGNKAVIHRDGTIQLNGTAGSIHNVGAEAENAPACNGWHFWHTKDRKGNLVSINDFRESLRREKA